MYRQMTISFQVSLDEVTAGSINEGVLKVLTINEFLNKKLTHFYVLLNFCRSKNQGMVI